jgi:hypothetical protein
MKTSRLLGTVFAIWAAAALAVAADKPDFSGNWKLDPDKSVFGPMPPPTSMMLVIDHKDPDISVNQSSTGPEGDQNTISKYSTDGKETVNKFMGTDVTSKAHWDGAALMIDSSIDTGGAVIKLTSKWTLSDDGKTLSDALSISSPQGDLAMTYVLVKQ